MQLKQKIEQDLKTALLAGDKALVMTLRGLKSSVLYAEVAAGKRDEGLSEKELIDVLRSELKKRQESAALYKQGKNQEREQAELDEAKIIENYLPKQLNDDELEALIDEVVNEVGTVSSKTMGQTISKVKELSKGAADGGRIASAVKQRMEQTE